MTICRRAPTRFDLYEWCVQSPDLQARFLRALHPGAPSSLCEDFCGPASIARAWTLLGPRCSASGVDRAAPPLTHARRRAREQGITARRFRAIRSDVLRAAQRADIIAAFNFAVCELHERPLLLAYLRRVRGRLKRSGLFACDLYAGRDAFTPGTTSRRVRTPVGIVTYTWEQRRADPRSARVENAIHFRLPKSRLLRDAFRYDWRLWTIAEMRDALAESGFASSEVHLTYGEAIDGEGNPVPVPSKPGDTPDENFVAYVVGRVA
ncbi:MAG: class I SAM-dependent methyltransferase [Phycisphaerae bacterium]|nr:class I SAM-dependent methyltransferase [Phycisphaerae bacterium]